MTLVYNEYVLMSKDVIFQQRVQYAMQTSAVNVVAEDPGTVEHATRLNMANRVLKGQYNLDSAALAVLTNTTIFGEATYPNNPPTYGVPDTDLQFAVNSLWNSLASSGV